MSEINEINLIPIDIIEKNRIRKKIKRGSLFLGLFSVFLLLIGTSFFAYGVNLEKEVARMRRDSLKIRELEGELNLSCQTIQQILEKRKILLNLNKRSCFIPILVNLVQDMDNETKLTRLWIEKSKNIGNIKIDEAKSINNVNEERQSLYDLKLWGTSKSYQTLSNFLLNLQKDKLLGEVTVIQSDIDLQRAFINFEISLCYYGDNCSALPPVVSLPAVISNERERS